MVSLIQYGNGASSAYAGLSTDSKPEISENGSAFIEMDTGKLYFYDASGEQWLKWGA